MFSLSDYLKDFDRKTFKAGENITTLGEEAQTMYVLINGELDVVVNDIPIITLAAPGTIIGEISVLLGVPRTATVTAKSDSTFYVVENLLSLFTDNLELALEITRAEFSRLMTTAGLLLNLKDQFLAAAEQVELDLSQIPEMAEYVSFWEETQASASAKWPFVLEIHVSEDRERVLRAGEVLLREGETEEKFIALKSGTIRQTRADEAFTHDLTTPGTVLNVGRALVEGATMTTLTAVDEVTLKEVDDVKNLFKSDHSAGFDLLRQVVERVVGLTDTFVSMKARFMTIDKDIAPEFRDKMEKIVGFVREKEADLHQAIYKS